MGFFIALLFVVVVLGVVGALLYLVDKDADVHDAA